MSSPDQNPDILKRRPVDISENVWEEHLARVKHITNGIKKALPMGLRPEELNDLVQEAQVYLLEHHESDPFYTGKRVAKKWLRGNFKGKRRRMTSHSDLLIVTGEGEEIAFDPEDTGESLWLSPEERLGDGFDVGDAAVQMLARLKKATPFDRAIVLEYLDRKHVPGNRFTRTESTAFESALRRLKKLGRQDAE